MKPVTRIIVLALLILIGAYSMGARGSWAYNFTVNNPVDLDLVNAIPGDTFCETAPGNGICTLRAAIQEANSFPEQHNITLPAGNYFLLSGELPIAKNITINGAGQGITIINGGASSRVFNSQVGGTLTLNNLTVQNGTNAEGGGIYNEGELILQNVTLTSNSASFGGGIFNGGNLIIKNSAISNNQAGHGGGIYSYGFVTIEDVTVDNNNADSLFGFGGGIYNSGTLILKKTTINGSVADIGGGLFNNGIIDLTNATLSGNNANSSGGGIYNGTGGGIPEAALANVTISKNTAPIGAGIFNKTGNTINLKNTIVAGNVGGNCAGAITSKGHNLEDENSCGLITSLGDLINKNPNLEPLPLKDNGGPTLTQKLITPSPAIDSGTGCAATDQRGYPRPSACDIGAYEVNSDNLAPAISTLIPHTALTALASGPDFSLTVNGYNFVAGSKVRWKGSDRLTAFVTTSELTATIPAADLVAPGTALVTVSNQASGGGISDPPATFTIATPNPIPAITTLTPDMRRVGGPDFTLTVNGSHFLGESLSVVLWKGIARPTTFKDSSQLTAEITADDLAKEKEGPALVTVSNSPPGGGISNPAEFTIGPPLYLYLPLILRN